MLALIAAALVAAPGLVLPQAHFNLADAARGQRGTCYTVFEGNTIEPFAYEVKGVMKNFLGPSRDVMLVKLLGDKPTFTGVVAGMSGSPCIQDGKFVGALAYSFSVFAKEPIAGITPIGDMMDVLALPKEPLPWRLGATAWRHGLDGSQDSWLHPPAGPTVAETALRPIATPLMLGGVPAAVRAQFTPWLQQMGFEPMAAGGASGHRAAAQTLVPGGSVSAIMVQGDVDVAATGTVTYVRDGRVLAFGHPFFGVGAVSFPMATADIVNTMVSSMRSFKMSTTGTTVGELTQDRLTAIGGVLGPQPRMIGIKGTVRTPGKQDTFQIQVARDLAMSPRLVAMGLASALSGRVQASERGTVRVTAHLDMPGAAPIELRHVMASERDATLLGSAGVEAARAFGALWDNPFAPPADLSLRVDAELLPEPLEEAVEEVYLDPPRVRPGDTLALAVRLRRRNMGPLVERFSVAVPRSWAGQDIMVIAAGAQAADRLAQGMGGSPQPTEAADIARILRARRYNGQLYVLVVRRGAGLHRGVDAHPFLPSSAVATLGHGPQREATSHGIAWEERRARPGVVHGQAMVPVRVQPF